MKLILNILIFLGYSLPHAACRLPFSGSNIMSSLMKLMNERDFVFKTLEDYKCAQLIKETYCQVRSWGQIHLSIPPNLLT
jgi:actin-related protein